MGTKGNRTEAEMQLVDALLRLQAESGKNDVEFAAKMGIKQGHWSHIKRGERGIGRTLAARLLEPERFPQLFLQVQALFLPANMQSGIYAARKTDGDAA